MNLSKYIAELWHCKTRPHRTYDPTGHIRAINANDDNDAVLELELPGGPKGPGRIIQAKSSQVRGQGGLKTGVITLLRDVSKERELDRMKSEFISTAAHELRTPLTSVKGFSEILLQRKDIDPRQQAEFLSIVYEKTVMLEKIINDMLSISRVDSGQIVCLQKEWHDLVPALEKLGSQYRNECKTHSFQMDLPEQPVEGLVDLVKFTQVMENLLTNAVKFSPRKSLIRVTCKVIANQARISVEDRGYGMTPDQAERVFDKFYRVDSSNTAKEGLGLGMSIAKNIVEAHGGKIWVESKPGKGTTVSFMIPLDARG